MIFKDFFAHDTSGAFLTNNPGGYLYSLGHIIFLIISIPSIFVIAYLTRNKGEAFIHKLIKHSWIWLTITEVIKIFLNHIFADGGLVLKSALPLYPCSFFMYLTPVLLYTKNDKVRHALHAFFATFLLFGGLTNFFLADVLRTYPMWNFFGLHTILYHYFILLIGVLLWTTKVYQVKPKDDVLVFKMIIVLTSPILLLDKVFVDADFNYFWFNHGGTTPLNLLSRHITNHWVWALVMYGLYYVLIYLFYVPTRIKGYISNMKLEVAKSN